MNSAIERLLTLRVSDIMAHELVTVRSDDTLSTAARLFEEREISGAPVIGEDGRCVGVLSGFDFIRQAVVEMRESGTPSSRHVLVQDTPDAPLHLEDVPQDAVEAYMSRDVQSVRSTDGMLDAARRMCQQHVHRVVVLDERGKPIGLLSSLDVVAAMIAAIEE